MQSKSQEAQPTSVISIFSKKLDKESSEAFNKVEDESEAAQLFADIQKRNREVEERLRKERVKANRAVLRSYRIKT